MSVNNVEKILSYIYPVTKQEIEFNGKVFPKIKKLVLNKSLFYGDECKLCGKCCIDEANVFLPFEVERMDNIISGFEEIDNVTHKTNNRGLENIKELRKSLEPLYVIVNSRSIKLFKSKLESNVYEFEDRGVLKRCHWDLPTEDGRLGCGIHQVSSLTCQMPHIRFLYRKDIQSTHIGTMQYGRNWAMKCPVKFSQEFSFERVNELLWKFDRLEKYCKHFHIDTYVPEILRLIESVNCEADVDKICGINIVKNDMRRLF